MISKAALEKIKKIIERNYHSLLITVSRKDKSLLSLLYNHNVLNDLDSTTSPTDIFEMEKQQTKAPEGAIHEVAVDHLNGTFEQLIEKTRATSQAGIEGLIRDYNFTIRNDELNNADRVDAVNKLIAQSSVGNLKRQLREYFDDAERDWKRIATTEIANAMGMGAIDRLVSTNKGSSLDEVYVFRIAINDARLCRYCREFYLDGDGTPAVYRLSTLLTNGSNYGKKPVDWKPIALATHPQDRETGVLQLHSGWKVTNGGKLEFIGHEKWHEYIKSKLRD